MHRNTIIAGLILCAVACYAGPEKIINPQARAAREREQAVAANTNTAVSFAALYADYQAAKSTSKREAVLDRILAKLAGIEAIEQESKKKARSAKQ